jgi:hypothetical protein
LLKFACAAALLAATASAQTSLARLGGKVVDPGGAIIPLVEVVATNTETGVATHTQSNEVGAYAFPALPPGAYTIAAKKTGFKNYRRDSIVLQTADVIELDLKLEIGELSESITVTADAPLLESTSATLGQVMSTRLMREMPLNARRSLNLVATSGAAVFLSSGEQAVFSLAGGRARNQNFTLDGGNTQNMRLGVGQVDTDPPVAAIREFKVISNNYSAEYGGSAGGIVVSTSKSGTNTLHGEAYEYFRNDALEPANFFASTQGTKKIKAPRRYNLFGGTLGGPVIKNRTHYFVSYEATRHSVGRTEVLNVPTLAHRRGDFSQTFNTSGVLTPIYDPASNRLEGTRTVRTQFPGNVIPPSRIDPIASQFVKYWPEPNRTPANIAGGSNFGASTADRRDRDNIVARLDHVFTDSNRLYVRYVWGKDPSVRGSVYPDPIADPVSSFVSARNQHTILFADTHTWSPSVLMDTRYSYATRKNHEMSAGYQSDIIDKVGLKGVPSGAFPALQVNGFANVGFGRERKQFPLEQHQFINNWSWFRGNHFVKFGGEARQSNNHEQARPSISGTYTFTPALTGQPGVTNNSGHSLASFLTGYGNGFSMRETDVLDRYSWYYAGFVQDDWRVLPSLTLNLGLRWEMDTPMADRNNRMNGFDGTAINPVSGTLGVVKFAGKDGWPTAAYDPDYNNFGPRFGFAWQPGRKVWVVRGGFGVSFEHPLSHAVANANTLGFESSGSLTTPDQGVTPAYILKDGIQGLVVGKPALNDSFGAVAPGRSPTTAVTLFERDRPTGYAMQYNFGIQRELPGSMVTEVTYLANLGRKMPNSDITLNQVPPDRVGGPGTLQSRRPYPQFTSVSVRTPAVGYMNYHAALFKLEKHLSNGLNFLTTYTWSRNIGNIDHESADNFGENQIYQDAYNRRADKGPNAIDIVHRYTASSAYDLPFGKGRQWLNSGALSQVLGGWTIGAISTIQSGGPFTVVMNNDSSGAGLPSAATLRANVLRNPNLPASQRTVERWFDTDAFAAPALNTFGNAGRGILRADGRVNFDFSLNKRFAVTERVTTKFSAEFFNAFNHPDFAPPNRAFGTQGFGAVSEATDGRIIQLGLNVEF